MVVCRSGGGVSTLSPLGHLVWQQDKHGQGQLHPCFDERTSRGWCAVLCLAFLARVNPSGPEHWGLWSVWLCTCVSNFVVVSLRQTEKALHHWHWNASFEGTSYKNTFLFLSASINTEEILFFTPWSVSPVTHPTPASASPLSCVCITVRFSSSKRTSENSVSERLFTDKGNYGKKQTSPSSHLTGMLFSWESFYSCFLPDILTILTAC